MQSASSGGSFLLESPAKIFTPEQFTLEHRAIEQATAEFFDAEVAPHRDAIEHQDFDQLRGILRKAGDAGLLSALVPEAYGGMELDLVSSLIVAAGVARHPSYSMAHGAQSGIGALPVLWFGTEAQKQKYVPRLAAGEILAAYALTEPQAGTDALAARTRAELSPDGSHYILNGQKMWITNGSIADLFVVFAQVAGDHFTAFLVERSWPGVKPGAEEKKMGLKGSSTTAVYFDNVRVPADAVLGEIGRGHIVALNTLNMGRLKIGATAHGECREVLAESLRYAASRRAFGKSIAEFGLIQHKLAEMAVRMFANESMVYRLAGLIQDKGEPLMKACEEFAAECSLVKVFASETLGYVTDEAVQIHGGYGYHQDYAVERAYRDARIYRIFEGTNEINRLVAVSMLLKRARKGELPLAKAPVTNVALLLLHAAYEAFGGSIEEQQEVTAAIADVMMYTFALQSATLRSNNDVANDMLQVFAEVASQAIEAAARTVLASCCDPDSFRAKLEVVQKLLERPPVNTIALRRRIAARLLEAKRYVVT